MELRPGGRRSRTREGRSGEGGLSNEVTIMYGVHRIEKFKGNLYGLQIETQRKSEDHFQNGREFPDSEINWDRTNRNIILVNCASWDKEFNRRAKEAGVKVKSDSVKMIGSIYTASQEFFTPDPKGGWVMDQKTVDYFNECIRFHVNEYCGGDHRHIISCVVHLDETTPHLEIYSDCLFKDQDNKWHLSAKTILGNRKEFHERQNRFYEQIGKPRGMDRGKILDPGEKLKHKKTADYHAERREAIIKAQETRQAELGRSIAQLEKRLSEGTERFQELEKAIAIKQRQDRTLQTKLDELCREIADPLEQQLLRDFVRDGGHRYDGKEFRFADYWSRYKTQKLQEMFPQIQEHDDFRQNSTQEYDFDGRDW